MTKTEQQIEKQETLPSLIEDSIPLDVVTVPEHKIDATKWTPDVIASARQMEATIFDLFYKIGKSRYEFLERLYTFKGNEVYKVLGYSTFKKWFEDVGWKRTTIYRQLSDYTAFRDKVGTELLEYIFQRLEQSRLAAIRPLIDAGAEEKDIKVAVQMSESTKDTQSFSDWAGRAARSIRSGGTINEAPKDGAGVLNEIKMDTGGYFILPINRVLNDPALMELFNVHGGFREYDPKVSTNIKFVKHYRIMLYYHTGDKVPICIIK